MAQFDVHRNADPVSGKRFPLLLDVQSGLLDQLATRVVVPLARLDERSPPISRLMPVFDIEGQTMVMHTAELAGVARKSLGPPQLSLAEHREHIVAALDVLVSGV